MSERLRERCETGVKLVTYAGICVALGAAKRLLPLPMLARLMWRDASRVRNERHEAREIAITLTASRWSGLRGRDCLQRSLLLYRVLSRGGADPRLVVGFRRRADQIEGHAWVRVNGHPVGDTETALAPFTACAVFGPKGRLCPRD